MHELGTINLPLLKGLLQSVWKTRVEYECLQTLLEENHDLSEEELGVQAEPGTISRQLEAEVEDFHSSAVLFHEFKSFYRDTEEASL